MIFVVVAASAVAVAVALLWWRTRRSSAPETGTPRWSLDSRIGALFGGTLDHELWADLEDSLIAADLGPTVAADLVARVRTQQIGSMGEARSALRRELVESFGETARSLVLQEAPSVVVVVGVNGSGKTTTVGKLASMLINEGRSVLVGAADTYRAAAVDQLAQWADSVGFDLVRADSGADPAAVAFDAVAAARARGVDVVVVDTAGRLHSDRNLMDELQKVVRVLRDRGGAVHEVLLVVDGTTGQNAIAQATIFTEAIAVTGVVLTKMDGSARGGAVLAIERDLGVPIKLIGVGERPGDLLHFSAEEFVDELLGTT